VESAQTLALVKEAFAAMASRDEARIARCFAPDAEWIAPPGNATARALGAASGFVGAAPIAHFLAVEMHRLFVDVAVSFHGWHADGATAVVELHLSSPLPNGAQYENDYCFVFTCAGGRIVRMREFMDTLAGERQIFAHGDPLAAR